MALTEFAQHERRNVSPVTYTEVAASAAARAFFYPSLLWNLARSRLQADWHWWDQITPGRLLVVSLQSSSRAAFKKLSQLDVGLQTVLLGALPFESMLAELSNQVSCSLLSCCWHVLGFPVILGKSLMYAQHVRASRLL